MNNLLARCRALLGLLAAFHLAARAQISDTIPPALTGLSLSSAIIDVTGGPATMTINLNVQDDLSGVSRLSVGLTSALGGGVTYWSENSTVVAGSQFSGSWQTDVWVPEDAVSGLYVVMGVLLEDRVGNRLDLTDSDLINLGLNQMFNVVSNGPKPLPGPSVWVGFDTIEVDTTFGDQWVWFRGGSDQPLFQYDLIFYQDPEGPFSPGLRFAAGLFKFDQSGTDWAGYGGFPRYTPPGDYRIWVSYRWQGGERRGWNNGFDDDVAENFEKQFGRPLQIHVKCSNPDYAPPVLAELRLVPDTINAARSDQFVSVVARVTDNLAGVAICYVEMRSPSGRIWKHAGLVNSSYWTSEPVANPLDQVLTSTLWFPQFSEAGTWTIEKLAVRDRVMNEFQYDRALLAALGFPTSLTVTSASFIPDGIVDPTASTPSKVQDLVFEDRAQVTVPPGVVTAPTSVVIDVLKDSLEIPSPSGFVAPFTSYVNIHLDPQPSYPLAAPGLTVVLPLTSMLAPGTPLKLFRVNETSGALEPSLHVSDLVTQVTGTVDAGGWSATFTGISRLSTVVALLPDAVVNWPMPAGIVYGTPLTSLQLNATADMPGTFEYSPPPGTVLNFGIGHVLSVTFTPSDTSYRPVTRMQNISVAQAPLLVTASNRSKAFGAAVPTLGALYSGFVNGDDASVLDVPVSLGTTATATSPPGSYAITAGGAWDANYAITFVPGTMTIAAPGAVQLLCDPGTVARATPTPVRFQMYVPPGRGLLPTSPNLQCLRGTTWVVLGTMRDDGTQGDLVAGDGTYTLVPEVHHTQVGSVQYRGSVAYAGQVKRVQSNAVSLNVVAGP